MPRIVNNPNHKFSNDVQRLIDEAYLGLGDTSSIKIQKVLTEPEWDIDDPVLEFINIMRKPEYFYCTCKWLFNLDLLQFQTSILQMLWKYKFPMLIASRGAGKSFLLAVYALLRAIFNQNSKIVIAGAAFRQSKIIFEYAEKVWYNSPVLQSIVGDGKNDRPRHDIDRYIFEIGKSSIIAIPIGSGETIRGLRSNFSIYDEFSSIPQEVFEVVLKGFGAVSANPNIRVKEFAKAAQLANMGHKELAAEVEDQLGFGNQNIISGTAYYSFNHFYKYWRRYKGIIESRGDVRKLEEIFEGEIPENFNWRDYCVIRIPYTVLPKGFMDDNSISQSKATMVRSTFDMEYNSCFLTDSDGFFKRRLIESASCNPTVTINDGTVIQFAARTGGSPNSKYVFGIDPASEKDNFAIVVLELHPNHRRIVYTWTINRQKMRERLEKTGESTERNFYSYCARKIRDLMRKFPTDHIGIDGQGGGIAVVEALHEQFHVDKGELPLWPYIRRGENDPMFWEAADKPTDGETGLHILHVVQFVNPDFTRDANHGLRFDFENKYTIFPFFDALSLGEACLNDQHNPSGGDSLEDVVLEIEELKDELTSIIHTQTATGRDHWDTPEVKLPGGKKGRTRKDRYTALVIANMVARCIDKTLSAPQYHLAAGYVGQERVAKNKNDGRLYIGPDHIVTQMNGTYGAGVFRHK